jgi:hypothetical protein
MTRGSRKRLTYPDFFKIAVEIDQLQGEECVAIGSEKREINEKIRRLEEFITPHKKQKAIDDRRKIVAELLTRINQAGAPENNTALIKELRGAQILVRERDGKKQPISDATARQILRGILRVKGQPGRKSSPRKPIEKSDT